jgi:hypothetical protein
VAARTLLCALALVFGAQSTGILEALGVGCAEPCDDDDDRGQCPPTCGACSCAPRIDEPARLIVRVMPPEAALLDPAAPFEVDVAPPSDGHAEDIAHVPIAA